MQTPAGSPNGDANLRPLAVRILLVQCGVVLALGGLCLAVSGVRAAVSSLAGGLIGLVANLYMTLNALRAAGSARAVLGRMLKGQAIKVAVTIGLFLAVARMPGLSWPALLVSYLATLAVFWFVPLFAAPKPVTQPAAPGQDALKK